MEPTPAEPLAIEESDLVKVRGKRLYVQNPHRGLAVVDISNPRRPTLLGQGGVVGRAGELYLRGDTALLLLDEPSTTCQQMQVPDVSWTPRGELALVDVSEGRKPALRGRYCLPGEVVASRLLGDFLYLVASDGQSSTVFSVDVSRPDAPKVLQVLALSGDGKEIHMTPTMLFVAAKGTTDCSSGWCRPGDGTALELVSLSAETGGLRRRGKISLPGEPQGRFHMSAYGSTFRIVTYDATNRESLLSIIDLAEVDTPKVIGELRLGYNEKLYATRFVGERAYVVTFRRTDPLWVVDLSAPSDPRLLGELHVPGWSDFLFPREGGRLLAVGRGDNGRGFGVSLFDVSDPSRPRALRQLTFGMASSGEVFSEANVDHRAVQIFEAEQVGGDSSLLVVPYSGPRYQYSSRCEVAHVVQLVDVGDDDLRVRGTLEQRGMVRRSLVQGETLLTLSDAELMASDVVDRDRPRVNATLTLGEDTAMDPKEAPRCYPHYGHEGNDVPIPFMCSVGPARGGLQGALDAAPLWLLLLAALGLSRRRSRR